MKQQITETSRRETAKADRRDAILKATMDLLREPGASVSSGTIAKRAGVSVATVYNLIGKREALIGCILNDLMIDLGRKIEDLNESDPIKRGHAVVTVSVGMLTSDPSVYRQVVHELSGNMASHMKPQMTFSPVELQISAMTDAKNMKLIEPWVDPVAAGRQILTSYNGAMFIWSGDGNDKAFLKQALFGFWTAMAAYGRKGLKQKAIVELGRLS